MKLLEKVLDDAKVIDKTRPLVIIDNAKTHTSRFTKAVMKSLKLDVKLLPPYCPEVAPVELAFRAIKAKLRSQSHLQLVDFSKTSGAELLKKTINSISARTWKEVWTEVIGE